MNIPTGFAQANFFFSGTGVPTGAQVTHGFDIAGYAGDPTDAATALIDHWATSQIDELQTDEIQLDRVLVKFGPNATGPSGEAAGPVVGKNSGANTMPNFAMLIQKYTPQGGRSGRGRLYLPCIPQGQVTLGGDVSGTWVTSANSAFESFRDKCIADDLLPVLLHGPDSPEQDPLPILSYVAAVKGATQRRRLRR